ncbi:MAG: hypothetical protein U0R44_00475 [Candidatus Micrarchaeia archaeon]
MKGENYQPGQRTAPLLALALATLFVIANYYPVLAPLIDSRLQFQYGDFTTNAGEASAKLRKTSETYTFAFGGSSMFENRFFLLGSISLLSDYVKFSDTQFHSFVILLSLLLGCIGLYKMCGLSGDDGVRRALLVAALIPFYFLNLWAVDRLGHTWIWFTYAVFPLFLFQGLEYVERRKGMALVIYSLLFAFFGVLPHSFIFMLFIHAVVIAYSLATRKDTAASAAIALFPLGIYLLMNLPALALGRYMGDLYPVTVNSVSPEVLSRNGGMVNLLSFANSWWPQVPEDQMTGNPFFMFSGILFFLAVFSIFAASFRRLGRKERILGLLSLLAVLGSMFIAQGTNNQVLKDSLDIMIKASLDRVLGVFREWARMSIMIPVFASTMVALSVPALDKRGGTLVLCALIALGAVNYASSPAWTYMHQLYGATPLEGKYDYFINTFTDEYKILWLEKERSLDIFMGLSFYHWNTPIYQLLRRYEAPDSLLDSLNIQYIVRAPDNGGLRGSAYDWVGCLSVEGYRVCNNTGGAGTFAVYDGAILVGNETKNLFSLTYLPQRDFAIVSTDGPYSRFVLMDDTSSALNASALARLAPISILEAETDMKPSNGTRLNYGIGASDGRVLRFQENGSAEGVIMVPREADYSIAVNGQGPLAIDIDGQGFDVDQGSLGFAYPGKLHMKEGNHTISVHGREGSILDVLWVFPASEAENLGGLFDSKPEATVIGYKKVDPTFWKASVDSRGPFMLSFAETYDPLWQATVTDRENHSTVLRPVRLFDAINGYWIDATGPLDIEVRYIPQKDYSLLLNVPLVCFIACMGYLGWAAAHRRSDDGGR